MSGSLPIVMSPAGLTPQLPVDLRAQLDALVTAAVTAGYTSRLPGSLIEDLASTAVFALTLCDQAAVETVNSLTPYGANPFVLNALGQQYGFPAGVTSNTSVYLVFTGQPGYVIQPGFQASDGTYQYTVQDGGTVASGGQSLPLYAVCTTAGSFAVPAGSVNALATSVPASISAPTPPAVPLSVTNPEPGTPGGPAETADAYRARVYEGIQAPATGTPAKLKSQLKNIPGVQARLVSVRQVTTSPSGYQVLCGGGDPYLVAGTIYENIPDFTSLQGSPINSARNVTVSVIDPPDVYSITFVNPPAQTTTVAVTWNTTAPNFVSDDAVAQATSQALVNYINSVVAGQPLNLIVMRATFTSAIAAMLDPSLIDRLVFTVTINGSEIAPTTNTDIIPGDPESFFSATSTAVVVTRG